MAAAVFCGLLACALSPGRSLAQTKPAAASFSELSAKADAARNADKLDEAAALYRRALALKPNWAEGWWSLGTLEYDRNSYQAAAHAFRKLVALEPKSGTARVMLGLCQFELGEDDAALAALTEGRQLGVANNEQLRSVVLYHEGILLQRKGRFEASQDILGQMCRQAPYPAEVALAVGAVALRVHDPQLPSEGTPEFQVMRMTGTATCLGIQRKYEDGRKAFEALISASPKYPNVHYAYGRMLLDANDTDGAIRQFQAEIANNPNDANARLRIASAKYRIDSAGGVVYAEEAVKLEPNLPLGHYLLGLLLLDTDNFERAIAELEIAQKAFPDQPKVYFALASAYSRAGRKDDAARARKTSAELSQKQESQTSDTTLPAPSGSATPPKN